MNLLEMVCNYYGFNKSEGQKYLKAIYDKNKLKQELEEYFKSQAKKSFYED